MSSLFQEGRVQIMSPILEKLNKTIYQTLGKLVVNKLNKTKDIGPYTCLVEDNFENRISATVNINQVTGKHLFPHLNFNLANISFFFF